MDAEKMNDKTTEDFVKGEGYFSEEILNLPNRSSELAEIKKHMATGKELMMNRELLLETEGTGYDEIQFIEKQIAHFNL